MTPVVDVTSSCAHCTGRQLPQARAASATQKSGSRRDPSPEWSTNDFLLQHTDFAAPFSENPRLFASQGLNCRQFVNFARQVAKTCVEFTPIDGPTLSGSSSFRSDAAPVRGACVSGSKAPLRKRGNEKAGFRRNRPFSFCTPRPCAGGHEKRRGPRRFF